MAEEDKKTSREVARHARREERERNRKEKQEAKKKERETLKEEIKKKKGWFQKIPTRVLLSPAGVILIFFAMVMEVIDWIPLPVVDQLWELPLEILFIILLTVLAKVPIKTSVLPFLVERIPILSDVLPTWVIRMIV